MKTNNIQIALEYANSVYEKTVPYIDFCQRFIDIVKPITNKNANMLTYGTVIFNSTVELLKFFGEDMYSKYSNANFYLKNLISIQFGDFNVDNYLTKLLLNNSEIVFKKTTKNFDIEKRNIKFNDIKTEFFVFHEIGNREYLYFHSREDFALIEKYLSDCLWKSFDGKKSLIIENGKLKINNNVGLSSAISDQVYQDLNKFLDKNKSRSILFYGPPGSGKSKAIAKVVNDLNLSCLYFDTSEIETIKSSIKLSTMLNPDIIILEDLDHVYDLDFLLHFVEEFRKKPKKIIFGSANIVTKLDDAFQRPERFDKLIELQRLDNSIILNIVHNDLSILEITKSWPISYVKELMERIDVLGKEEALKSIGDLELRIKNLSITNYSNNRTSDVDFNE